MCRIWHQPSCAVTSCPTSGSFSSSSTAMPWSSDGTPPRCGEWGDNMGISCGVT